MSGREGGRSDDQPTLTGLARTLTNACSLYTLHKAGGQFRVQYINRAYGN